MASEERFIREGATASIQMQLLSDSSGIDLTGYDHVEMRMVDSKGVAYKYSSSSGPISIVYASSGTVQFTPMSSNTFLYQHSPYHLYWWCYQTSTAKFSVPEVGTAIITVSKDY